MIERSDPVGSGTVGAVGARVEMVGVTVGAFVDALVGALVGFFVGALVGALEVGGLETVGVVCEDGAIVVVGGVVVG